MSFSAFDPNLYRWQRSVQVLPFENVVAPGSIRTHGCAELVQIWVLGFSHELSSRVPALIIIAPGNASASVASDDPQFLQNFRESDFPLSPLSA
jgi:hypothetical protein